MLPIALVTLAKTIHVSVRVELLRISNIINSLLQAPETCSDKKKNQDETDIDCGGITCRKCNNTRDLQECFRLSSVTLAKTINVLVRIQRLRTSNIITSLISAPETCKDKIKNQDETDVDCGGIICPKCNNTKTCKNTSDCLSKTCKNNVCIGKY